MLYFSALPTSRLGNRWGVSKIEHLITVLLAVMAGVISHVICKWLDGKSELVINLVSNDYNNQEKINPQ